MKKTVHFFLWLIMGLGSLAITHASLVYFNSQERAPFIIEKLPLAAETLYLWALRVHVTAAALALPGCLILSLTFVVKRWPRFHRICGRVIGIGILGFLVPSGFYLSFFARGGWRGTVGFILSGIIVMIAMIQAIRAARLKQFKDHRRFSFHVLGQLSVAVTSRLMLAAFSYSNLDQDFVYIVSLWIPVVGTYMLIEHFFPFTQMKFIPGRFYEKITRSFSGVRVSRSGLS